MDCNNALELLADREGRTLTGVESAHLSQHIRDCDSCCEVAGAGEPAVWKLDDDAVAGPGGLVLPTIDPELYEVEGSVARGGMGRIVRAHDRRLGRTVAIKEVLAHPYRARFEREAMITARLQHPAIVPIYEAGQWPHGTAFYTMRLVTGATLADAIEGADSLEERVALTGHLVAITDALAFAHSKNIIHRDLKPLNVLVGEFGETVVIDWGLARELGEPEPVDDASIEADATSDEGAAGLTRTGAVLGTPGFMAPEQARGDEVDCRTDVYALGAILYTVLVGHRPYRDTHEGVIPGVLIDAVLTRAPTPILELEPRAPADLVAIAERAMSPDMEDRYDDARAMAAELHRFSAGQLLSTREYGVRELFGRWVKRHRTAVTVGAVALIALVAVGAFSVINITSSRNSERAARLAAEASSRQVEARNAELVFGQAELALDVDPTLTLGWLRRYPPDGPQATAAGILAHEARRRGVSARVFVSGTTDISGLRFVPGRPWLVASSFLEAGRVWDLDTGALRALPTLRRDDIFYDRESDRFFAAGGSTLAILWESASGPRVHSRDNLEGKGNGPHYDFLYSERSKTALVSLDGDANGLWHRGSGALAPLPFGGVPIAMAGGGTLALIEDDKTASLYDLATSERLHTYELGASTRFGHPYFDVVRDGPLAFATSMHSGGVRLWRREDVSPAVFGEGDVGTALRFSPGGGALAAAFKGGLVVVLDVATRSERCRWRVPATATALAFVDDETIVAGLENGDVIIASTCGAIERRLAGHREAVTAVAASPDGKRVASSSNDQEVRVHDRATATTTPVYTASATDGCSLELNVYRRGDWRWVSCIDPDPARWIGRRVSGGAPVENSEMSLAQISDDGSTIAGSDGDGSVVVRDGTRSRLPFKLDQAAGLSADGALVFQPTRSGVEVWDVETRQKTGTIAGRASGAFPSPDGRALLVDRPSGVVVMDMEGAVEAERGVHLFWPLARWSSSSRVVALQAAEQGLAVYDRDAERWTRLTTDHEIVAYGLSADGRLVAAATREALVLWDLATTVRTRFPARRTRDISDVRFDGTDIEFFLPGGTYRVSTPTFDRAALDAVSSAIIDNGRALSPGP